MRKRKRPNEILPLAEQTTYHIAEHARSKRKKPATRPIEHAHPADEKEDLFADVFKRTRGTVDPRLKLGY
ncbi:MULTISPECIES: hypothetical protein [unclassified Bradyrhizobium]|uniref:hypothetical protein n=1 Tax=unclassified Bradyrhizobium TaxID=2631580 RepID=UPI0028EAAEDA|nr:MULTISPECIES: hypothetical protein [unclassified Bradyrhizobium]